MMVLLTNSTCIFCEAPQMQKRKKKNQAHGRARGGGGCRRYATALPAVHELACKATK